MHFIQHLQLYFTMDNSWNIQHRRDITRMFNHHETNTKLLIYFLENRKDVKLNFIIFLVFGIFGFDCKKLFCGKNVTQ